MNVSTSLSNFTPADLRTIFSMPSSYHERDTPGHVALWITGQAVKLRATEVSQPFGEAASLARLMDECSKSLVERRGGICEAHQAVALSWWVAESPGLPFAQRCQAGRWWWRAGLMRWDARICRIGGDFTKHFSSVCGEVCSDTDLNRCLLFIM